MAQVLDLAGRLDAARRAAADDRNLTPAGRLAKVEPLRQEVERQLGAVVADAEAFAAQAKSNLSDRYKVPPLSATDAAGAIAEMELRGLLRTASGEARGQLMQAIGADPGLAAAVLRSAVPLQPWSDLAARVWREHVDTTDPLAAAANRFVTAGEWALAAISPFRTFAADPAGPRVRPPAAA